MQHSHRPECCINIQLLAPCSPDITMAISIFRNYANMAIADWRTINGIDGELFAVDGKAVAEYGAAKAVRLGAVEELNAEMERQGG